MMKRCTLYKLNFKDRILPSGICLPPKVLVNLCLFLRIGSSSVPWPEMGSGTNVLEYVHKKEIIYNSLSNCSLVFSCMSLISFLLLHR